MTSGGDAPGMNPGVRAVVRAALGSGLLVKGIRRAYEGLVAGEHGLMLSPNARLSGK